jgi:hypothetical protein
MLGFVEIALSPVLTQLLLLLLCLASVDVVCVAPVALICVAPSARPNEAAADDV